MDFNTRSKFINILISLAIVIATTANVSLNNFDPVNTDSLQFEIQLETLSPEEKIGQLFLISFNGNDTSAAAPIFEMISTYHIGGVILDRDNDNFTDPDQIIEDCWTLTNNLQLVEYNSSNLSDVTDPSFGDKASEYIPLIIGITQEGDLSNYSDLITGLSPIPSQLSIGATWNPELAVLIGEQVGRELSQLGINLLLGPSLDVLSNPIQGKSDLGIRSFGGDPYWVGKFGQAYIKGIHSGSSNSIAVVGKYFPGLGGSDRLPEEEVATVRKSLEQLQQIDLAPFFAVTGNAPSSDHAVDALLNSHIRYQGLQGNIRSTTRPISLDPQAFDLLMSLEPFGSWREAGGVIISDNLGSQALQQLYDPSGETYNLSRIALDAFIAGNDILYLGNLGSNNKPIPNHEISATLDFFTQKYIEDQEFAERVDASVIRILTLKNSIYPSFGIDLVLKSEEMLGSIGISDSAEIVSRESVTLINPTILELDSIIQEPLSFSDRVVILSDTEIASLCDDCYEIPTLSTTALEDAIYNLYGPHAGRQIGRANFSSYSFKDLETMLDFPYDTQVMIAEIYNANLIVVATLALNPDRPYSDAFSRLLSERQDLVRDKKIIVFAFGAPYYLDATNISKISAYFALYTKITPSLEVAARILFKELPKYPGSLPVSVPGINYDLISATSPDPNQIFSVHTGTLEESSNEDNETEITPTPPVFRVEDVIDLYTGIILDHNGNPVPDGTPVTFFITSQGESSELPPVTTINGSAATSYLVQTPNNIIVHAESSLAKSISLEISILGDSSEQTPEALTTTPEITQSPVSDETTPPTGPDQPEIVDDPPQNYFWRNWTLSILAVLFISAIAYRIGAVAGNVRWGSRWGLSALIGGTLVYNYLGLSVPGLNKASLLSEAGILLVIFVIFGALTGWGFAFIVQLIRRKSSPTE